ncbi:hypothetical protein SADUNF_Sadunf02G0137000 [Salix dunnii]|uniref:Uncharacterized protein n=1 Tax=Salix dunnii TaxID=1413687 RepID=A0A835N832_9ROSI|nr:hypothetical protein SADUNF_Sadunf02G0137000 [Salix dunnii]
MVEMDTQPNGKIREPTPHWKFLKRLVELKESGGVSVSVGPVVVIYNRLSDGLCKVGSQAEGLGLMTNEIAKGMFS